MSACTWCGHDPHDGACSRSIVASAIGIDPTAAIDRYYAEAVGGKPTVPHNPGDYDGDLFGGAA